MLSHGHHLPGAAPKADAVLCATGSSARQPVAVPELCVRVAAAALPGREPQPRCALFSLFFLHLGSPVFLFFSCRGLLSLLLVQHFHFSLFSFAVVVATGGHWFKGDTLRVLLEEMAMLTEDNEAILLETEDENVRALFQSPSTPSLASTSHPCPFLTPPPPRGSAHIWGATWHSC